MELLEKLASEFAGVNTGDVARELLEQVRPDRKALEQLIGHVGEENLDFSDALGWIGERVSRMKLNHDDPGGIGAFQAFETIGLGIMGNRALWETLRIRQNSDIRVAGFDYDALIQRADEQLRRPNQFRMELSESALDRKDSRLSKP